MRRAANAINCVILPSQNLRLYFTTSPTQRPILPSLAMEQRNWDPKCTWDPDVERYLTAFLGAERFAAISSAIVRPPLQTCLRVNTLRTTPEDVLRRLPDALSPTDRHLLAQSPRQPYIHPLLPFAILVPGSGPHHGINYDAAQGLEVIVGRRAGESMLRGAECYAPGVLACTTGIVAGDTVSVSVGLEVDSGTLFGVTRGTVVDINLPLDDPRFPDRANLFIGTGRAEVSRSGMNPSSSGLVLTMENRVFRSVALGHILKGDIMLQSLPSLLAAVVLNPLPGSRVMDMCAAPGGKSTAMAQIMGDKGEVVALDRSHAKATNISTLARELGITCIHAYKQDATRAVATSQQQRKRAEKLVASSEAAAQERLNDKVRVRLERIAAAKVRHGLDPAEPEKAATTAGFEPESFEYVLLDAPCSALGLRPRLVISQSLADLRTTASYQRKLIDAAVQLVKPGGFMVYSTCTINPGENEANVRYLLDSFSEMKLVGQTPRLGGPGLVSNANSSTGDDDNIEDQLLLTEDEAALVQRFDPSSDLDTMGFFIAKFQKMVS